ncbi:endopeptidase La [Fluviispira sanaruensis]|uniref:Lon protease n=1 Tax=Fluviispira sanaruensis TaxID=2493639 RepID=A0A4V0P2L1_FLUSA|nr:endopeptidase La [Fluviispira sanaruensis]BBH53607.1 endopeptidase La [Fluviispira sanaruensis]
MADKKTTSRTLPLLPLRELLVFPHTVVPLFVGREKSIKALDDAMARNREIFLAAQKKPKSNDPLPEEIYEFGTIAQILQLLRLPDGTVKILVEGKKRGRILKYTESTEMLVVEVTEIQEPSGRSAENEALVRTVKQAFDTYVKLNKKVPPEMVFSISSIEDESRLADTLVVQLANLKLADKQRILETVDPAKRLEEIFSIIQSEIEILRVEKKIRARVKRQMEKTQKEYYLNEQMNAIQKELGNADDIRTEIAEIESKIKAKKLSDEAREKLKKEVKKLRSMSPMSAEATVVRNYIDTVLSLPWADYANTIKDQNFAEEVLNEDHFGLEKVKERILEYLAVTSLSNKIKGPILCLVGPPGVGKTSLAKSVARSTGRTFSRIALGGVRDEAEIRGHRRTYIGAMPGKILNAIKKASSGNPVILLDEIDKMSSDFRGDPSSAMLEVLDPEQNHAFNDHYLDLDYDLSQALFIATANSLSGVPKPLLDRMEIIYLSGYTEQEKINIGQQHLIQKSIKANGLDKSELKFENSALEELVRYYTREAGVRNLEREISSVCRKIARELLKNHKKTAPKTNPSVKETAAQNKESNVKEISTSIKENAAKDSQQKEVNNKETNDLTKLSTLEGVKAPLVDAALVQKYLGPRKYSIGEKELCNEIGIGQGLAYTEVGGDLLVTEVAVMSGKGNLKITGKLGDVMQESAQAAFSYVRSRAAFLGLEEEFYSKIDIHVHFPEGAIPKDGPSAGITMATALVSALTKKPFNREVAMTGEITLRGRVLPIGGLKEKLLAAHRGGIKRVIIPKENERDLLEIPKNIIQDLEVVPVDHMDTVLLHAIAWEHDDALETRLKNSQALALAGVTSSKNNQPLIHH